MIRRSLKYIFLLISLIFFTPISHGQEAVSAAMSYLTDYNVNEELTSEEVDGLYDVLLTFLEAPLEVNVCSKEALLSFPLFTNTQALYVLSYRNRYGRINSIAEFSLIPTFRGEYLNVVLPFLSLTGREEQKKNHLIKTKIIHGVRYQAVQLDSSVIHGVGGSTRFKLKNFYPGWNLNINADKDYGESGFTDKGKFQHLHGSVHYSSTSERVVSFVVGAFKVKLGNGLVIQNGFNSSKFNFSMGSSSFKNGKIRAHSTFSESGYLNGLVSEFRFGKYFTGIIFGASTKEDARIQSDVQGEIATTLYSSGIYASPLEKSRRNALLVRDVGGSLSFASEQFNASWNHNYTSLSVPLFPDSNYYNQSYLRGDRFYAQSISFNKLILSNHLQGELGFDKDFNFAFISQLEGGNDKYLFYKVLARKYSRGYQSYRGQSYQRNSQLRNEEGIALKFNKELSPLVSLELMFDLFRYPSITYRSRFINTGSERTLRLMFSSNKHDISVRFKWKKAIENEIEQLEGRVDQYGIKKSTKLNSSFKYRFTLNESLFFKSSLYANVHVQDSEVQLGSAASLQVNYRKEKWNLRMGFTSVRSPVYNTRIYAYESTVQYSNPFVMLYGNGYSCFMKSTHSFKNKVKVAWKVQYRKLRRELDVRSNAKLGAHVLLKYHF